MQHFFSVGHPVESAQGSHLLHERPRQHLDNIMLSFVICTIAIFGLAPLNAIALECTSDQQCSPEQACNPAPRIQRPFTYDFGESFVNLPPAFMPPSGKGCSLVLQVPYDMVSLLVSQAQKRPKFMFRHLLKTHFDESNWVDIGKMMAFPYCSSKGQQQEKPPSVRPDILFKTNLEEKGSWYILDKLQSPENDKTIVFGTQLRRLNADKQQRSVCSPRTHDRLRNPSPTCSQYRHQSQGLNKSYVS